MVKEFHMRGGLDNDECIAEIHIVSGLSKCGDHNNDLLADVEARALTRRKRLFKAASLITKQELCGALGVSVQMIDEFVSNRIMFYITGPEGEAWYPSFFADSSIMVDVQRVCLALGDLTGDVKWQFFMTGKHSLNRQTPISALSANYDVGRVLRTAAEFRERSLGR